MPAATPILNSPEEAKDARGGTVAELFPLTHAQESLFFLDQLTNGLPVYHMPQAFRVRGKLNRQALETAVKHVVGRHPSLRARVIETAEGPRQFSVENAAQFRISYHELSGGDGDKRLADAIDRCVARRFDLASENPFRVDLFNVGPEEHVLLFDLHHLFGDMTSLGILFREIAELYGSYSKGSEVKLPPASMTVGAYAVEQKAKPLDEETISFWRECLKDSKAELEFPLDRTRPRLPSFHGGAHYLDLPEQTVSGLGSVARKNKCSPYMLCLAALQVLVHRYTGQERFAIATPFSEREDERLENTIGYLVNLLPIPCEVKSEQTFRELLSSVRSACLNVYAHHNISFRRILKELAVTSDSPKPPLARIVFQYFPEVAALTLPGLDCSQMLVHSHTSKFDLCFSLWEQSGKIGIELEYDSDIFEPSSIEKIASHYKTLLQSIVTDSDQQVASISLMDEAERALIDSWNRTARPYSRNASVHSIFEERAGLAPEATALRFQQLTVSYNALNKRANQIAHYLQGEGIKPGDFVGICLDRSPDLIAALLAILKTGAAFVPFDAKYPRSRLEYMFRDSDVRLLLTDSRHAHIGPAAMKTILLDLAVENIEAQSAANLTDLADGDSVAYVMYTSGSTGNPKGTIIPHRAIVRLVQNTNFARFSSEEVFLAFAPVSFDAATLEIWGPLLNGATLAIYPPEFESIEQFAEVIQQHKVTTLWLTAGLFNTIVDRNVQALRGLRQLLVGGDVLSVSHIRKAQAALPGTTLINGYGPTENTTFTCCYNIPNPWPAERSIPIGHPIANTTVYILDARMQRVPIGVPGDLYTGGDGLSLGYWKQPELTERAFVANPFDTTASTRLYRTGDRARYLADGSIEFLGRRDCQVKIRGFRIELGEIEAAYRQLPSVQDAVVVARPDNSGGKVLAAYVVLKSGSNVSSAELQAEAAALLPPHACPSTTTILAELPLGPNGKVNRNALPEPSVASRPASDEEAPANSIEAKIAQIWRQILEVPAIRADDNFFQLGGESLRATRAISQINQAFNCRLGLPRLFEAPTVRQMARVVEKALSRGAAAPLKSRPSPAPETILPEVNKLSEEDVDALLTQLLSTNDPAKS